MKNIITIVLKAIIQLLASSAICHYAYTWNNLDTIFKVKLDYFQWVCIIIIVHTLIPINLIVQSIEKNNDK